jgi:MFS family permease
VAVAAERIVRAQRALPRNVRALGWVSFSNDLASELAYPIVPLFLRSTLGASFAVIGLIEGVAEGVAVGLRGVAGWLSDRAGERRKPWIVAGYGLTAASRPLLAAAPAWGVALGARLVDRTGKAARTAPRDALIRDSTPPQLLGASFGYHRAMDTAGAVVGPLVAVALLSAGLSLRTVLWVAVVPGFATLLLLRAIREAAAKPPVRDSGPVEGVPGEPGGSPAHTALWVQGAPAGPDESLGRPALLSQLPGTFWAVLGVWVVFSLGNSSDVFLILRAKNLGLGFTFTVLAYAIYNLVYSGLSWPLGALSDRIPRAAVLGGGLAVFALVYLGFAFAGAGWAVWPLFAVYGAYIAATEGVAKAWVGDRAPAGLAGTAYGLFAAASGAALLVASVTAGLLWSHVSARAPFFLGAASAVVALVLLVAVERLARA